MEGNVRYIINTVGGRTIDIHPYVRRSLNKGPQEEERGEDKIYNPTVGLR